MARKKSESSSPAPQQEPASEPAPDTFTFQGTILDEEWDENGDLESLDISIGVQREGEFFDFHFAVPWAEIVGPKILTRSGEEEPRSFTVSKAYAVESGIMAAINPDAGKPDEDEPEPGASTVPNDRHYLTSEKITVTQNLTEKEKAEYADEMAKLDAEIEELEVERDTTSKSLKKRIDAKEDERRKMS
ncbi:MAG: hypothetical protein LBR94_05650, partial [Desulfovibrio sp.]|nr:hypothetical protein [Desulfovibrio sp.]